MKKIVFGLVVVVIIAVVAYAALHKNSANQTAQSTTQTQTALPSVVPSTATETGTPTPVTQAPAPVAKPKPTPAPAPKPTPPPAQQPGTYTMAQVATHASASSCWSAINGGVYDLTSWINQHPGGKQAILSICGKDGSSAFNDQHGGERRPANELAGYKIGTLAQ